MIQDTVHHRLQHPRGRGGGLATDRAITRARVEALDTVVGDHGGHEPWSDHLAASSDGCICLQHLQRRHGDALAKRVGGELGRRPTDVQRVDHDSADLAWQTGLRALAEAKLGHVVVEGARAQLLSDPDRPGVERSLQHLRHRLLAVIGKIEVLDRAVFDHDRTGVDEGGIGRDDARVQRGGHGHHLHRRAGLIDVGCRTGSEQCHRLWQVEVNRHRVV